MGKYNEQDNDDYLLRHNVLGIDSQAELEKAEVLSFSLRAMSLEQGIYTIDSFTIEAFQDLHLYLFQDIYPFAGKFRDVQLMKGNTRFCQVQFLESYALSLFHELQEDPPWTSLEQAAARLAYFKSELNMLHPFREGNGRTTRIFIRAYALNKGIDWAYETVDQNRYLQAMIESVIDVGDLQALFLETISSIH